MKLVTALRAVIFDQVLMMSHLGRHFFTDSNFGRPVSSFFCFVRC